MGLMCTLGLVTCLQFNGQAFTAEEAMAIELDCEDLLQASPASFETPPPPGEGMSVEDVVRYRFRYHMGYLIAERLQNEGLKLSWPTSSWVRRFDWTHTCLAFKQAYYTDAAWKHP